MAAISEKLRASRRQSTKSGGELAPHGKFGRSAVVVEMVAMASGSGNGSGRSKTARTAPKMAGQPGDWLPDPGDVITHVNGYAVKTVQDVVCAVNAAEDPDDIQLVIRDVNDGKQYVFYVSAAKK